MNELIERLAEQATIRGEAYLPGDNGHPTPTEYFDKEKFAHLIVKTVMNDVIQGVPLAGIAKKDVFKLFGIDDYISLRCEVKE